jgi:hypothetical protein
MVLECVLRGGHRHMIPQQWLSAAWLPSSPLLTYSRISSSEVPTSMTQVGSVLTEPVLQEGCLSWQSCSQCCIKVRDSFEFVSGVRLLAGPMLCQGAGFPGAASTVVRLQVWESADIPAVAYNSMIKAFAVLELAPRHSFLFMKYTGDSTDNGWTCRESLPWPMIQLQHPFQLTLLELCSREFDH